ncbi:MAG: DUF4988 domain-containing protein [Candidatus Amulumruptor sp.]|nr:DUF4988 domain-containing protein [Candidatus Amulumruptor sp.]
MRKAFLKASILAAFGVAMSASFTSCKDYDDDINNLQTQVDAIKNDLKTIQDMVSQGAVITSVTQNANGVEITLSNNKTFNITNGKDGKDADVWTIVKNAAGQYVWALNGVATEYPAQGPAGENGAAGADGATGATGNYFKPNAETGKFDEYKADGTLVGATDIEWRATVEQAITAVDNGNTVTLYGLKDAQGNEFNATLAKNGTLAGLEFIPDLYVDGIETMSAEDISGDILNANLYADITSVGNSANVLKGEISDFAAAGAGKVYAINGVSTASYILNPNNANIEGVEWSFLTNDAVSRASKAVANVQSAVKNEEGNLDVTYVIADKEYFNADDKITVMALQGTLTDGSVVSSNFVRVLSDNVNLTAINYNKEAVVVTAADAINGDAIDVYYNATTNLAKNITISGDNGNIYTLDEIEAKYGLTMKYSILKYYVGADEITGTREDKYGSVNAEGVYTPTFVNADGEQVTAINAGNAARTAIGRQPVVVLELVDAEGNIILGGLIKLQNVEEPKPEEEVNESIYIGSLTTFLYLCDEQTKYESWEKVAGKIVASTGMTIKEFQENYVMDEDFVYIEDGKGGFVAAAEDGELGHFDWTEVGSNTQTQTLSFTVDKDMIDNWYDGNLSATPVTKTLYAKFSSKDTNTNIYVGYEITVIGQPTVSYTGQLASQWAQNYTVAPLNPAVAANAKQTTPSNAEVMTFTIASLWENGKPVLTVDEPYKAAIGSTIAVNYTFSENQPSITGASGTVYNFETTDNGLTLIAAATNEKVASLENASFTIEAAYGEAARDIVNAQTFDLNNPATLFNVDINITYGDCNILVPQIGEFKVGVGRPIYVDVNSNEIIEITDASGDYVRSVGTLANIYDWQDQALWTANEDNDGFVANETVNGVNLWDFWMGNDGKITFGKIGEHKILTNSTNSLTGATVLSTTRQGFDIKFQNGSITGDDDIDVTNPADLFGTQLVYENNSGNSVVEPFYIFIPVVAHYTWGDSKIGYATVKILPTQTSIN